MKRAWRTTWGGVTSIVAAETPAQAKAITHRSATDAGYGPVWNDIWAWRAPEHDGWAEVDATGVCWAEENLPKESK
jgi:hypothetical protein